MKIKNINKWVPLCSTEVFEYAIVMDVLDLKLTINYFHTKNDYV